jgi:hypothetical protein
MFWDFFKTAVVGPIAAEPLSVAGSCARCVGASGRGTEACNGFGPGCLCAPVVPENPTDANRRGRGSPLD